MQNSGSSEPWVQDIIIETTKVLTTTGGTVWAAAHRCAEYLEAAAAQGQDGSLRPGVRVLELGAGCGFLGMLVARNCPQAGEVCLTEQAYGGALDHLRHNVQLNRHLPNMASVTTAACDWSHFTNPALVQAARGHNSQLQLQQLLLQSQQGQAAAGPSDAEVSDMQRLLQTQWDIIIGSDLIYNKEGAHALPQLVAALMTPAQSEQPAASTHATMQPPATGKAAPSAAGDTTATGNGCCGYGEQQQQQQPQHEADNNRPQTSVPVETPQAAAGTSRHGQGRLASAPVMYYAHTKHRFDALDVEFFEQLEQQGLQVEEVVEDGRELPAASPPPFTSLFPDMRIAVFRISKCILPRQNQQ